MAKKGSEILRLANRFGTNAWRSSYSSYSTRFVDSSTSLSGDVGRRVSSANDSGSRTGGGTGMNFVSPVGDVRASRCFFRFDSLGAFGGAALFRRILKRAPHASHATKSAFFSSARRSERTRWQLWRFIPKFSRTKNMRWEAVGRARRLRKTRRGSEPTFCERFEKNKR